MATDLNQIPSADLAAESEDSGVKDSYLQLVPAVDQAVRLLFCLANTVGGEASLTQLTKEVGISKSKGLAILNTLRSAGLVTRDDRTKNYGLGPNLLPLGPGPHQQHRPGQGGHPVPRRAGRQDRVQHPSGRRLGRDAVRRGPAARSRRLLHPHRRGASLPAHLGGSRPGLPGHAARGGVRAAPRPFVDDPGGRDRPRSDRPRDSARAGRRGPARGLRQAAWAPRGRDSTP